MFLVKLAKKIPCHTNVKKQIPSEKDENHNKTVGAALPHPAATLVTMKSPAAKPQPKVEPVAPIIAQPETNDDKNNKIQDFELQRKLKEEQNKMKRNLLQDAISKITEKTQAEAKKLDEIRLALDVLDSELSNDVGILRKQIETATLHFNNVEKHYSAIERNFLKAKQDLYQAHEKKEMLTEHLYTIIAHNEDRKAMKLGELMDKVGLSLSENGT